MKETRSVRIQLMLEPSLYNRLVEHFKETKLVFSSDSMMFRYIIERYLHLKEMVSFENETLKQLVSKTRKDLSNSESLIENLRIQLNEERKKYDIQIHNLKLRIEKPKRRKKQ